MKQIRLILIVILGSILGISAKADTVLQEQFSGYATGTLGSAGTGNTGGVPGWNGPRNNIFYIAGSGSLWGTNLGLVDSLGDMITVSNTAGANYDLSSGVPAGCYNLFAYKNTPYPTFPSTTNVNLYCSFLYRFNDNTGFDTNGSVIACMNLENGGFASGTPTGSDAYWQLIARTNASGQIQIGIAKNIFNNVNFPGLTNWDSTLLSVGQTFFVVTRLQVAATNGVAAYTNDESDLWINPSPATFGITNEANVPAPDTMSPPGDGAPPSSTTGPGRFFIFDNGPSANIDEIRIATNWASVTPPFGSCVSPVFTTQPSSRTQSAEISAVLTAAAANATSPTYKWQISQNGGASWSDIPGANQTTYITPNLQFATDNGNEYRSIAYVACDNTYATSSVATVTLTQPTATANGVVLDDVFPGSSFRDAGPVVAGSNGHSQWFTEARFTTDLYTDPSGTGLIAIPQPGSSTLYLGYFVPESVGSIAPVELAVGKEMIATLKFIPSSYAAFTNNGALRIGLFDYADSGNLVTNDNANVSGSTGQGAQVRGYMLSLDYGQVFSDNTPLNLYARNGILDNNLMGTTGDYLSMDSGPTGGAYSNTAAFAAGTQYTLTLTVARTAVNTCTFGATITGGTLSNLTFTATDTNDFGYHRFDAIAIRPNKLENAPDQFTFPEFKVQVTNAPTLPVTAVALKSVSRVGNSVTVTWQATPSGADVSSGFTVYRKSSLTNATWTPLQSGITATNYTDSTATGSVGFYRVSYP